jgi:hypothetical protein
VCGVWCVVCGVWCVVCGVWCVVCGVWCVVCGVWCVVCGVWCVMCGMSCVHVHLYVCLYRWFKIFDSALMSRRQTKTTATVYILTGTWLAYIRCIRFVVDVRCLLFVVYLCVNLVQNHCRRVVALTLVGTRTQNLQIRSLARYPLRHKSTGRCRGHDVKTLKIRDSGGNLIIHTFEYYSVQISKVKNARLIWCNKPDVHFISDSSQVLLSFDWFFSCS